MGLGKIKRLASDAALSNCVRARAKWSCEKCGTYYPEDKRQGLQCSHLIGRGHYAVRFDPKNCMSLCTKCHHDVTAHPIMHINLWREQFGSIYGRDSSDSELNSLLARSTCEERAAYARDKGNQKLIAAHYRQQFEELIEYAEATEWEEERYDFTGCKYR